MIKIKYFIYSIAIGILIASNAFAQENLSLQTQRLEIVKQYVTLLGEGDYQSLSQLFTQNGFAVSSASAIDNPMHFYKKLFTQTLSNPHTRLINIFEGKLNDNMFVAYFNFSWKNKAGKNVSAIFLTLFNFEEGTKKIKSIYVFGDSYKEDIMRQLESGSSDSRVS